MKILMITPEVAPVIKVGGLADVVGALPKALAGLGHQVRVVCPLYGEISKDEGMWIPYDSPLGVSLGGEALWSRIWESRLPGSDVEAYYIEYNHFFERSGVYNGPWGDHPDNAHRFIFLCRAALNLCYYLGWMPDVVHCHDWTTGIAPVYLNTTDREEPLGRAASVLTIHNLQHQGHFTSDTVKYAHLPDYVLRPDNLESMGGVSFLKGGIYNATKITTVSSHYALEIQTPEFGHGLNHVLKFRAADLIGQVNGADVDEWNPAKDKNLPARYSTRSFKGKAVCKAALQKELGLEVKPDVPIFGVVSRLYWQKGLDLLASIAARVVEEMHVQIAVLGAGEADLEARFSSLAENYRGKIGVYLGYNHALAHLVYAGSDFFLMPSRFEPCGLSQMYSMIYGTPPLVRATGGLVDTVVQYEEGNGKGTGLIFEYATEDALYYTMGWACSTYYDRPKEYRNLQLNGMKRDFSWNEPAKTYEQVYTWAVKARQKAFSRVVEEA